MLVGTPVQFVVECNHSSFVSTNQGCTIPAFQNDILDTTVPSCKPVNIIEQEMKNVANQ